MQTSGLVSEVASIIAREKLVKVVLEKVRANRVEAAQEKVRADQAKAVQEKAKVFLVKEGVDLHFFMILQERCSKSMWRSADSDLLNKLLLLPSIHYRFFSPTAELILTPDSSGRLNSIEPRSARNTRNGYAFLKA